MNLIRLLLQLIQRSDEIERKACEILKRQDEQLQLSEQNLKVLHQQQKLLHQIALSAGDIRVALPLIREIHSAVVPKPVVRIKLLVNHKEISNVQTKQGFKSNLSFVLLDEDGNVTTTASTPQFAATDLQDFSLEVADDSESAVLTSISDLEAETDVTVSVDGITSNVVSYENSPVVIVPPPPKPVASIVLTGTTPA